MFKIESRIVPIIKPSGHNIAGMLSPDKKNYVHFIPKNAHSFLKVILQRSHWSNIMFGVNQDISANSLCLLRDPIRRWISGTAEFITNTYNKVLTDDELGFIKKILENKPALDSHTDLQISFLYKQQLDKFLFYYIPYKGQASSQLSTYLSNIGVNVGYEGIVNSHTDNLIKKENYIKLIKLLEDDTDAEQRLKHFYAADYELIEWVNTNQKWIK